MRASLRSFVSSFAQKVLLIAELHQNHVKAEYHVPDRPHVIIMPVHSLNEEADGEAYFSKQRIVKVYQLHPPTPKTANSNQRDSTFEAADRDGDGFLDRREYSDYVSSSNSSVSHDLWGGGGGGGGAKKSVCFSVGFSGVELARRLSEETEEDTEERRQTEDSI